VKIYASELLLMVLLIMLCSDAIASGHGVIAAVVGLIIVAGWIVTVVSAIRQEEP